MKADLRVGADGQRTCGRAGPAHHFSLRGGVANHAPQLHDTSQLKRNVISHKSRCFFFCLFFKEEGCVCDAHDISGGQAEVDADGAEREQVAGAVVLVQPAAELLQRRRAPLELLGQGQQQQHHVGQQEDGKLEGGWEQPAGVDSWGGQKGEGKKV